MLRNLFKKKDKVKDQEPSVPLETMDSDVVGDKLDSSANSTEGEKRTSWFNRLKAGLSKTQENLVGRVRSLLRAGRKIDEELMEEIEEILIQADVGVNTTMMLMENVRDIVHSKGLSDSSDLESVIQQEILSILDETDQPLDISDHQPYVILVLGVNGAGKTTTIGKLAHRFRSEDNSVLIAAADTFRAAAADQLQIWCDRAGAELVKGSQGADPASVVFDAVEAGKSRGADVVIVDTAGRLHTKKPLMDELSEQININIRNKISKIKEKDFDEIFSGLFWVGQKAIDLGLADGIGSLEDIIKEVCNEYPSEWLAVLEVLEIAKTKTSYSWQQESSVLFSGLEELLKNAYTQNKGTLGKWIQSGVDISNIKD